MSEDPNKHSPEHVTCCMSCGRPTMRGNYFCNACIELGIGPCLTCEGGSLDIEEDE
jgi:hypothetical protein